MDSPPGLRGSAWLSCTAQQLRPTSAAQRAAPIAPACMRSRLLSGGAQPQLGPSSASGNQLLVEHDAWLCWRLICAPRQQSLPSFCTSACASRALVGPPGHDVQSSYYSQYETELIKTLQCVVVLRCIAAFCCCRRSHPKNSGTTSGTSAMTRPPRIACFAFEYSHQNLHQVVNMNLQLGGLGRVTLHPGTEMLTAAIGSSQGA